MVKYICDICSNEIKEGKENGKLLYVEKTFMFDIKHQKQEAVKQNEMIFCCQCLKGLKNYLAGQKSVNK